MSRPSRSAGASRKRTRHNDARVVWPPEKRSESARDALERLMRERGLARRFEPDVEREAQRAARRAFAEDGTRVDLRDLATFTVDPSTARDFDDAISAQRQPGGTVRVWVHIADVSAHVPVGSQVDVEARGRATSVYVPGAVEPMLPHALSSDACSLVPGEDRLAVTVELELRGAEVVSRAFHRSLIRSDVRLDYERVDRIFAGSERACEPWGEPLQAARQAAAALAAKRERTGALVIDSEEPEFSFDPQGEVSAIAPSAHTESHRLIEHLMIAANEAVATHLFERRVGCLYRVHERPSPERIHALVLQLDSLGVPTPPMPHTLTPQIATELIGPVSQRVDEHVRRTGHGRLALSSLVLRSLKQAYYSPANLGHAGLHSACYCHFTSPIRRYPDLVCHRALLSTLGFSEQAPAARKLSDLGEWTSERERDAAAIERDADDVAACFHLERLLYERGFEQPFDGEVTGLLPGGAFVAFGEGSVYEGMIPVRLMPPAGDGPRAGKDWWQLNEHRTVLHGRRSGATLRLGDPIAVRVTRVNATRGRVDLEAAPPTRG